jgi:stearoyl-CoA desaturase (delta-9 desaturase)
MLWPQRLVTAAILLLPIVALVLIAVSIPDEPFTWEFLALGILMYVVIAHGVTIGFHRLFTHRSFQARRPLKVTLAVLGSMSFQGSLIGWVADHRRHHAFADRPGDPHSPVHPRSRWLGLAGGLWHAHVGWFFKHESTSREKYAADLLADRDLVFVDRLFVPLCVLTLVIPFGVGYAITGRFSGALAAFLWAGVVRVGVFHHVTWSTNSICHSFGSRPFRTVDQSTNMPGLAILSMGEAWHNAHHAFPYLARHGVDRGQLDSSARLIRLFELAGWATAVRWPVPARLDARRVATQAR